jgi:basic membrane protein A
MKKLTPCTDDGAAALGFAASAQAQEKLKACFIYVGPVGDFGYSYQHHQGRAARSQKELGGDKVETRLSRKRAGRRRRRARLERFARSGCKIIFTTSFGFMDADQGRRQVPGREVRARDRLQAAPNVGDLQFPLL